MSDKPIVLDRPHICKGRCGNRETPHRLVVYPDSDSWTCSLCGHREVIRYKGGNNPSSGLSVDEAQNARRNLMGVVGDLQTRRWSKGMGDKDKSFIGRIISRLISIGKDLNVE